MAILLALHPLLLGILLLLFYFRGLRIFSRALVTSEKKSFRFQNILCSRALQCSLAKEKHNENRILPLI